MADNSANNTDNGVALEIHDLTVSYDKKPVLWGIDLTLQSGIIAGVMGPNGAGKSTLVKAIMGLLKPSNGYTRIFNQPLEAVRDRVSYVPQRETVDWNFPASVYDIVSMGRYKAAGLFSRLSATDKKIVEEAIEMVNLSAYRNRQISQLSGGQQQRVFLARALAQQADIYFMDEPFAGVDMATEAAIITLLKDLKAQGKTIVVVHHDLQTAQDYFDWLILLNVRLVASAPIQEAISPQNIHQTYGGKLTMLSKITQEIGNLGVPTRE